MLRVMVSADSAKVVKRDEVAAAMAVLADPGFGVQVQALPSAAWRTCRGDDPKGVAQAAAEVAGSSRGVYWTLNPCPLDLGQPMASRFAVKRRWLMVDIDPKRERDTNATDAEHEAARTTAAAVQAGLSEAGWPLPVVVDSGNGFQLLYRVDLTMSAPDQALVKDCIKALAARHNSAAAEVDERVHDGRRLAKLPGTLVRKGPMTDDRPHRWATLVHVPDPVEEVPKGLMLALAGGATFQPAPPPLPQGVLTVKVGEDRVRAYARSVLKQEVANVVLAARGDGNDTLNRAAFALGTLVGAGAILQQEAEFALLHAATLGGRREEAESRATIASGMEAGKLSPRDLAFLREPSANGKHEAPKVGSALPTPPEGEPVIVRACDIKPREIEWLWPGRLAVGKLTTFAGKSSKGKTFVTCDVMARVSRGLAWPDGQPCNMEGQSLFISGDDDADDTLVPRLMAAGADLTRVAFLKETVQADWTLAALGTLDRAMKDMGDDVRVVVMDPPTSFLGGIDDHRNSELRSLLTPLKDWAASRRVAVILITHVNKAGAQKVDAMERVMGGVAWVTGVRAAFMFLEDPDDKERFLFLPIKSNIGKKPPGLAYKLVDTTSGTARVDWQGEVAIGVDEAMSKAPKKPRDIQASEWLVDRFRERLEWPSNELFAAATQENISRNAIFEAKGRLKLPSARKRVMPNGDQVWVWWVPEQWEGFQLSQPHSTAGQLGQLDAESF